MLGVARPFAELLVGQDPARIEHCWSEMVARHVLVERPGVMSAVAGIDIALWDLKGKALGVPVYDLLGGPTRERVRVYVHLRGDTAGASCRGRASRGRRRGYTALRYGPLGALAHRRMESAGGDRGDGARREALREALGDEVDLLLDAHTMLGPAEAAYLGHALEPTGSSSTRTRSGRSTRRRCGSCATRSTCRSRPASSSRTSGSSSR